MIEYMQSNNPQYYSNIKFRRKRKYLQISLSKLLIQKAKNWKILFPWKTKSKDIMKNLKKAQIDNSKTYCNRDKSL